MCVRYVLVLAPAVPEHLLPFPLTADEERVFLISEELEFRIGEYEREPTFVWRDIDGDTNEFYEFVASGTNAPTRAFFETCMYRAMYERKYRQSADTTTDEDLSQFIWKWAVLNSILLLFTADNHSLGLLLGKARVKPLKQPFLKNQRSPTGPLLSIHLQVPKPLLLLHSQP